MIYKKNIQRMLLTVVLSASFMIVQAQSVTYNHDSSVMNQFTIGETGVGSFTPDFYYDVFHKNYRNGAMETNKQVFRSQMQFALSPEEGHAENLDTALNERKRVELKNIADRTPGVGDIAWQFEKSKIESKLEIFKNNIEKLTIEGAPAREYQIWMEKYNCINCGLQAVRDAYMPQGKRKEQYLAIYKDVLSQNTEVCEYIALLRSLREIKNISSNFHPLPKTQLGMIARTAHGRWKVALSASSGIGKKN